MLAKKPDTCKGCPLYGDGLGFSRAYGEGKKGVFILAEALGEEEERESRPLVGASGKFVKRMCARTTDPETNQPLDLDKDFVRGNVLSCAPPQRKWENAPPEAIQQCAQYWQADVRAAKPKAILAVGAPSLGSLTGHRGITQLRGCVFPSEYAPVVATLHPSYLARGKMGLNLYWRMDLLRALLVARHGIPQRKTSYVLYPTGTDAQRFYEEWVEAGRPPLATDIETPHGSAMKDEDPLGAEEDEISDSPISEDPSYTILRISFSFKPNTAITMPWVEPFTSWSKKLLAEAPTVLTWNGWGYDGPRLAFSDAPICGDHVDGMMLFHYLYPALPMGLKPNANTFINGVPFEWVMTKVKARPGAPNMARDNPTYYSALDSDLTVTFLLLLIEQAVAAGKWPAFQRQFVELDKVLRKMTRRGLKTDPEVRRDGRVKFGDRLAVAKAEIQPLVPQEVLKRKVFKKSEEWLRKSGNWVEGRMVEVVSMEKPPKPKKLDFRVFYLKQLKKGPCEKSKLIKAFTAEEALSKVEGALRAEESCVGSVGEGNSAEGAA